MKYWNAFVSLAQGQYFKCPEANPTSVDAGRFAGYAAAGVNQFPWEFNHRDDLIALGRMHTVAEAKQAFDVRNSFDRVTLSDLCASTSGT